jgi:hypothetical protein
VLLRLLQHLIHCGPAGVGRFAVAAAHGMCVDQIDPLGRNVIR